MTKTPKRPKATLATIDCARVEFETSQGIFSLGTDTITQVQVEPQIDEQPAIPLITKGILRALRKAMSTITGHKLTITDSLFIPELMVILQGGAVVYDTTDTNKIVGYNPPTSGTDSFYGGCLGGILRCRSG
jgi:hypothetical protein